MADRIDQLVENVWLKGFARYVMPTAITIAVSVAGWALNRVVTTIDGHTARIEAIGQRVEDTHRDVKELAESSQWRFGETSRRIDGMQNTLDKYDGRLRNLEMKR